MNRLICLAPSPLRGSKRRRILWSSPLLRCINKYFAASEKQIIFEKQISIEQLTLNFILILNGFFLKTVQIRRIYGD